MLFLEILAVIQFVTILRMYGFKINRYCRAAILKGLAACSAVGTVIYTAY